MLSPCPFSVLSGLYTVVVKVGGLTESLLECVLGDPSREALWACCLENPLALA